MSFDGLGFSGLAFGVVMSRVPGTIQSKSWTYWCYSRLGSMAFPDGATEGILFEGARVCGLGS